MNVVVPFCWAKVGDEAYTYARADGEMICDFAVVTDLEFFDDRDSEERLKRQRWLLVAEDELVLENPYPIEDDEVAS